MGKRLLSAYPETKPIILLCLFGIGVFFAQKVVAMILIGALTKLILMFLGKQKGKAGKIARRFGNSLIIVAGASLIGLTILFFPVSGSLPLFLALPFVLGYLTVEAGFMMEENFPVKGKSAFKTYFYPVLFLILIIIPWQFNDFFAVFF